jgi:membrane protein YqaA with SNARE-associated domain
VRRRRLAAPALAAVLCLFMAIGKFVRYWLVAQAATSL